MIYPSATVSRLPGKNLPMFAEFYLAVRREQNLLAFLQNLVSL
jgi:hypothetical protein